MTKVVESSKLLAFSVINPVWVTQNERDEAGPPVNPPGPGPTPSTWVTLNQPCQSFYGYNPPLGSAVLGIQGGKTTSLLIDPVSMGFSTKPSIIMVGDQAQRISPNPKMWLLDAFGAKTLSIPMGGGNNQYSPQWPKGFVYQGQRILIECTPASDIASLLAYWGA